MKNTPYEINVISLSLALCLYGTNSYDDITVSDHFKKYTILFSLTTFVPISKSIPFYAMKDQICIIFLSVSLFSV